MLEATLISSFIHFIAFVYGIFVVLCLIGFWYVRSDSKTKKGTMQKFSIVIPFRNEEENIKDLLDTLASQAFDENLEGIFLVDDHSNDKSIERIKTHSFYPFIQLIENQYEPGKKGALLTAWNKIQATYVLQLDADVRLPNKWYTALRKAFDHDVALYILPIKFEINTLIQKLFAFEFASLSMLTISSIGLNNPQLANGAHLMYDRRYLDQIDKRKDWMQTASGDDMSILHH
ncbi:MAG: glycosyltransferase, partial [Bacteroidota bacterium]